MIKRTRNLLTMAHTVCALLTTVSWKKSWMSLTWKSKEIGWQFGSSTSLQKLSISFGGHLEDVSNQKQAYHENCCYCSNHFENEWHLFYAFDKAKEYWRKAKLWHLIESKVDSAEGFKELTFEPCCYHVRYMENQKWQDFRKQGYWSMISLHIWKLGSLRNSHPY